jgi:serine/threonine-protein kinase RIO1
MSAFLKDAIDMARLMAEEQDPARRAALWDEARRCCELLLERGLEHRDLNLGNILRSEDALYVIDLDRAVMHDGPVPEDVAERVRERMERSRRKVAAG